MWRTGLFCDSCCRMRRSRYSPFDSAVVRSVSQSGTTRRRGKTRLCSISGFGSARDKLLSIDGATCRLFSQLCRNTLSNNGPHGCRPHMREESLSAVFCVHSMLLSLSPLTVLTPVPRTDPGTHLHRPHGSWVLTIPIIPGSMRSAEPALPRRPTRAIS